MKMRVASIAATLLACTQVAAQVDINRSSVLAAPGGRYVFGQISEFARHQFMLDTQTGRLWQIICVTDAETPKPGENRCKFMRLDPVYYDDPPQLLLPVAPGQQRAPSGR